jgi:hypothetical protein
MKKPEKNTMTKAEKFVLEAVKTVDRSWKNMAANRAVSNHFNGLAKEKFPPEYKEAIQKYAPRILGELQEM